MPGTCTIYTNDLTWCKVRRLWYRSQGTVTEGLCGLLRGRAELTLKSSSWGIQAGDHPALSWKLLWFSDSSVELSQLSKSAVEAPTNLLGGCHQSLICPHICWQSISENFFCLSVILLFKSPVNSSHWGNSNPDHIKEILGSSSQS